MSPILTTSPELFARVDRAKRDKERQEEIAKARRVIIENTYILSDDMTPEEREIVMKNIDSAKTPNDRIREATEIYSRKVGQYQPIKHS